MESIKPDKSNKIEKSKESNKNLDQVFFALADNNRRKILNMLAEGPMTIGDIASHFDTTLANTSKNISLLEKCKLVRKVRKGRIVYCHIDHDTWLEIAVYISGVASFWENRLNDLEQYISDQKS